MKRTVCLLLALAAASGGLWAQSAHKSTERKGAVKVYFTDDISPAGLQAAYDALGKKAAGNVAVKIHTGAPGGHNFLQADFIKRLVQSVNGTIVECNTAPGGGARSTAAMHRQVAKDHGFTAIAPVDIMDEDGEIALPVRKGKNIRENFVGSHFKNYDYYLVLSHFKGHAMGGFGGAMKNISIGIASSEGKSLIHTAGRRRSGYASPNQNAFLESMAEAAGSVMDYLDGNIVYINVMNRISVDCDCVGSPAEPDMHDIGILASLDPVALDKACVDLIYASPDGKSVIRRIESRNGEHTLDHAAALGLGSLYYELVKLR